jgi:hypothetical protein
MIFIGKHDWNGSLQITLKRNYSITYAELDQEFLQLSRHRFNCGFLKYRFCSMLAFGSKHYQLFERMARFAVGHGKK